MHMDPGKAKADGTAASGHMWTPARAELGWF